jgi:hypothetical protein
MGEMEARHKTGTNGDLAPSLPAHFDVQGSHVTVVARSAPGRALVAAFARAIAERPETRSVWGDASRLYVQLELRVDSDAWSVLAACVEAAGIDLATIRPSRRSLGWA